MHQLQFVFSANDKTMKTAKLVFGFIYGKRPRDDNLARGEDKRQTCSGEPHHVRAQDIEFAFRTNTKTSTSQQVLEKMAIRADWIGLVIRGKTYLKDWMTRG